MPVQCSVCHANNIKGLSRERAVLTLTTPPVRSRLESPPLVRQGDILTWNVARVPTVSDALVQKFFARAAENLFCWIPFPATFGAITR